MKKFTALWLLASLPGCSTILGEPERQQFCYQRPSGERRCFSSEQALSADVFREQVAVVRVNEEQARKKALAVVAAQDAKDAAARARAAADHVDRVQDGAFDVLVELRENAREAAVSQSAAPSPEPQTQPAP